MRLLIPLLFSSYMVGAKIIKNLHIPSCSQCVHYKPTFYSDYSSQLGKCEYFGEKDIHSGDILYDYADACRRDEKKCGINGSYFEKQSNIQLKRALYSITQNWPFNLWLITILLLNIYYIEEINK